MSSSMAIRQVQLQNPRRMALLSSASVIALGYAILALLQLMKARSKARARRQKRQDLLESMSASKASHNIEFDIVIVGGGTAGCVLASRLSEDHCIKVLLLEAGGSGVSNPFCRIPAAGYRIFRTKDDYALYTTGQENAGGRKLYWPRAKLLGGCSSINAMMFHAGAPSDYDEWASSNEDGASEWSYQNCKSFFQKFEKFLPSPHFPNVDDSLRGSTGPVKVGYFGHFSKVAAAFIPACEKLGIPLTHDVNTSSGTLGVTKIMTYIDNAGERVSTESAYLTPDVLARPNLTIMTHAQVTKILFAPGEHGQKRRASGVEFCVDRATERFTMHAKREVVLSSGAVHTPHLLMLSGIGPAAHLASHGIPVAQDLPGVGQHLMDHPAVYARFRCLPGLSLNYLAGKSISDHLKLIPALFKYRIWKSGPLTCNVGEAAAFVRSSDQTLFPDIEEEREVEDTTSGEDAPDIELFCSPLAWEDHGFGDMPEGDLCCIGATLLRPSSKGSITLKSADPFDAPVIDPNYLSTPHDITILTRSLKLALRVARTQPFISLLAPPTKLSAEDRKVLDHDLIGKPESELESIVRARIETLYHPCCTARMASLSEGGVVDFRLKVYGVEGLRIADASVFPTIVSGHTAAPTIAVGEKAADMIKDDLRTYFKS